MFPPLRSGHPSLASLRDGPPAVFRARPPFTALLVADAGIAQVLVEAARAHGRSIPGDLSVACFQGRAATAPAIAGPRVDFEELGTRAVMLLGEPRRPAQHLRQAAVWFESPTVAAPRARRLAGGEGR